MSRLQAGADRLWCRILQSTAGEEVLRVHGRRPVVRDHLERCSECRGAAAERSAVHHGLDALGESSWTAPPDFVDRVMGHLEAPTQPTPPQRSPREKLIWMAVSGAVAVLVAVGVARRRGR